MLGNERNQLVLFSAAMNAAISAVCHHREARDCLIGLEEYSMRQSFLERAEMMTGTVQEKKAYWVLPLRRSACGRLGNGLLFKRE